MKKGEPPALWTSTRGVVAASGGPDGGYRIAGRRRRMKNEPVKSLERELKLEGGRGIR